MRRGGRGGAAKRIVTAALGALAALASAALPGAATGCARHANVAEVHAATSGSGGGGDTAVAPGEMHPSPFTAAQIRDATKAGRTYRFKVETPDAPATERVMTFTKVDAEGAELATSGEPPKRVTWEALRKHAEFPAANVTVHEEKVTVPAGTFDCVVYVVIGEGGEVRTFYFAKSLPGAPVLFFTNKDAKRVMTSTLVEHRAGR